MLLNNLQKIAEVAKVSDTPATTIMNPTVITVSTNQSIKSTILTLINKKISGAPVVDSNLKIVGVVTEYDLMMQAATKDLASPITYTTPAITVKAETTLKEILVILIKQKIKRLPVVDNNNTVIGIVARRDLLSLLMAKSKKD